MVDLLVDSGLVFLTPRERATLGAALAAAVSLFALGVLPAPGAAWALVAALLAVTLAQAAVASGATTAN